ncbi:MAG: hypothetical protein JRG91_01105 [Deltaproteobacteria bacterium]|nr:hypothetical protein [Deltaproteobacteria bacterium]
MRAAISLIALGLAACGARAPQAEPVAPLDAPVPVPPVSPEAPEPGPAGPPSVDEAVKQRIEELFMLCKSGDYDEAAGYLVYRGEDELREWKTVHDYSTEEGKKAAHGVCNRISATLSASDSWEFEDFETEEESEGLWLVWEVVFWKGGQRQVVIFAFLEVEGVIALGDID